MKWMKQCFLGKGSYGEVHLAVEPAGKMKIAVKSAGIENSSSLRREGQYLDALRGCPYIVQCFGEDISVENGGHVYNLLLEYAPGGTLRDMIEAHGGCMPETEVARCTYQLLRGIRHVHSLGFVHCDLKPENVLVFPAQDGRNRLKLCDFGLAERVGRRSDGYGDYFRGTLLYAPPESLTTWWTMSLRSYEAAKDIWALGCIVIQMITGKLMWQVDELTMKISLTKPEMPNHISHLANHFLEKCLQIEPQNRWTAEKLLDHPFVRGFAVLEGEEDEGFVNPKDYTPLISYKDLFGSSSPAYPKAPFVEYVLFPEKDDEDNGCRFMFPCGEDLMKQI
ncbi:mitogen-activated protein kinase kinase kinase 17-like [Ipomoea triloba]|uniref:mitogen-activated protein kinase kinase kinase 17-like n=1 Tax=Ipomoea triloba TaxID=35885 RepID=UPI00125DE462|nr:mitogen-activated protein kinase kinase kinase 17-like [Ipomoea triloba]